MLHELLSNPHWLEPQINYLIWLQGIRESVGTTFDGFFLYITKFGELLIPTIAMSIIYWCIDFESGLYLFTLNSFGLFFAKLFKMAACIYRPWVLSDEIKPLEAALARSGGYSFPSGHCMMAATSWGGLAFLLRKKKIICTLIILFILLVAFSRNYVGVHTPQDVLCGIFTGLILVFAVNYLLKWCKKDKNRYLYSIVIMNIMIVLELIYIVTKQYPTDYVNGKLLVNPQNAIYVAVMYLGWISGLFSGAFLCKRFFPFDTKQFSIRTKIIIGIIGTIMLICGFSAVEKYLFDMIQDFKLAYTAMFLFGIFITAGYPYIFQKIKKSR